MLYYTILVPYEFVHEDILTYEGFSNNNEPPDDKRAQFIWDYFADSFINNALNQFY